MRPRNRSAFRMILSSPITLVIAAIALFFLARAAWNIHVKAADSASRLESAQNELSRLEENQKTVAASVDRLSTPAGVEAEIREKYHAVQPGESVAVIVDTPTGNSVGEPGGTASSTQPAQGFWASFWRFFMRD